MNRTYSIVYNAALGEYQVVSEKTKTRRSKARKLLPIILASLLAPTLAVDINDGKNAINVSAHSAVQWVDYIFNTMAPVDPAKKFNFDDWKTALNAYVKDPNNSTKKSAWEDANQALKDNVAKYFLANKGFLNIDQDKTFTLTASVMEPTEKKIQAGELVAISVGAGKNLTYELNNPLATPKPEDEPEHTSRLFNIEKDGTLIMVGEQGSSITIKGFKINYKNTKPDGGAIYNAGNVFLGDNVTFEGNTASFSFFTLSSRGVIYNNGIFSLRDNAKFKSNTAFSFSAFSSGGAIYNNGIFSLGDNAKFEDNKAWEGGAINNNKTFVINGGAIFTGNEANTGGAIYNTNGTFTIGNETAFIGNKASSIINFHNVLTIHGASSFGGAIYNVGTLNLGNDATFTGNSSSSPYYYDAYGGAIYNKGTFNLYTGTSLANITLFSGNLEVSPNTKEFKANSVSQTNIGIFNITGNGMLDMRDPFSGEGTFNKSGNGIWKLGGENTTANLNINEGTLYLYAKDEVDNRNRLDATAKVGLGNLALTGKFTLGSGAALSLGGQGHTINADSVDIQKGANIRFNLHAVKNDSKSNNTSILTFNIATSPLKFLDKANIDIHTLAEDTGTYTLINGVDLEHLNTNSLYVRGESIKGTLLDGVYQFSGTANGITLVVNNLIYNEILTWNGSGDSDESKQWNMVDKNWKVSSIRSENQYLVGDQVVFDKSASNKDIKINVERVTVSDMVVSGGDYQFSGGVIETTPNILGNILTNPTQKLIIQGDAKVDFTGITGRNNFAGGIALEEGTLSVSTLNQLGTNLSKMTFGSNATLNFTDSVIIDGKGGSDQNIRIIDKSHVLNITITDGKTLTFKNNNAPSSGGAIINVGKFTLGGDATFTGNTSSYGGAIYNSKNLILGGDFTLRGDVTFTGNTASVSGGAIFNTGKFTVGGDANFTGNTSSYNGGAIYNDGTFTLGGDANFTGNITDNTSSSYSGGAIFNNRTFNLATGNLKDIALFTGNLANGKANSIHQTNGIFNITGDGTLDMRDPFTGDGTFNKSGNGVWKLGGENTTANLNINEGRLYLYAKDEVANNHIQLNPNYDRQDPKSKLLVENPNYNPNDPDSERYLWTTGINVEAGKITVTNMTLGTAQNGATLFANGGNTLSGTQLTLYSGSTFGFKVDQNTPAMTWNFKNNIKHEGDREYTFEILNATGVGKYHLLSSTNAHGFDKDKLTLNYKNNGQIIGRVKDIAQLDVSLKNIYLIYSQETQNAIATWNNGNPQATWDSNANNWNIDVANQKLDNEKFLDKDQVVFGQNTQQQTIEIANTVVVGDMTVDGGDYKFTGQGITTDKTGVGLSNPTEQLKLINGAKVDFTEMTGTNNFANGIDLEKGTLSVSTLNQLGTNLSKITFGTKATLNFTDSVIIDGKGSSDQNIIVGVGKELEIKLAKEKTLIFKNNHNYYFSTGGVITNYGTFILGDYVKFEGNTSFSTGGAIYNYDQNYTGKFTLGNHAKFEGNISLISGGAIYNNKTFTLGDHAKFEGNISYSDGGAIINAGYFNLVTGNNADETLFTGNLANGKANSIHQENNGIFNITGNGTLDMRDPFTGEGTFNKSGNGIWKLGGENTTTNLNVNEGRLYLYAKDEVANNHIQLNPNYDPQDTKSKLLVENPSYNPNDPDSERYLWTTGINVEAGKITVTNMTLGTAKNGATLFANGGNTLLGTQLTLHSGSTFGFKVDPNNPVMTWDFKNNIKHEGAGKYTFDVAEVTSGLGQYHLLKSTSAHGFDKDKLTLNYQGNTQTVGRLKTSVDLEVKLNDIYLNYSQAVQNAIATWANTAQSATWDSNTNHWNIEVEQKTSTHEKFLDKDQVVFGQNTQQQMIDIANKVIVGDMTVDGGDYKFTGQGITTDKTGVGLSNSTEKLTLTNGSKVDFTGITGTNNFANGIDLNNGALTVSKKGQLGTDLSGVKFGAQGTLNLDIAKADTFNATGSLSGSGTVNKQGAGTWQLDGTHNVGVFNLEAGTLALGSSAEITATTMSIGSTNQHSNLFMQSSSLLSGNTLKLNAGGAQGSTTFNASLSADNLFKGANIAAMNWDFKTIQNDGGQYVFDISPVTSGVGKYHLLNSTNAHGFDKDKLTLNYQGNTQTVGRLKTSVDLEVELNDIYFNYSQTVQNAIATWANTAQSATWDSNTNHWNIDVEQKTSTHEKFLDKDQVVFGQNTQQQTIEIANTVVVGDMTVDGGDYKFTGQGVTTDKTGVGLSNSTEKLTLTNGAKVDFTGITGTNKFANGIDLDNGALTVSKKEQLGTDLSGVKFGAQGKGTLNLDIAASDTFDAKGSLSGTGTVNKQGSGTWLLDANSINNMKALSVDAGTLALGHNATTNATTMALGTANNGVTLLVNGGNKLSGDQLTLHSGSTFEFKISKDNFIDASTNSANDSVMHWDFTDINHVGNQQYTIGVSPLIYDIGRYHLLSSQNAHGFDVNKLTLTYLGHDPKTIERIKNTFFLKQDAKNIYLEYGKLNNNGIATWTDGSHSGKWNVADENWSVKITDQQGLGKTFLTQDHVIFGKNTNQQFIDITHDVIVAGMEVTGDYKFTGQGISTSNAGVGLSNATEQLSIQNGAKVDFTGITGINNFANGIDLDVGALTVSNKNQLGTDLSGIQFGAQGILNLDIADKNTFDASGSLSSQQGTVNKQGIGTWLLDANSVNSMKALNMEAGTLTLSKGTEIKADTMALISGTIEFGDKSKINTTTMNIGSANQHSNLFMQSSSLLSGNTLNLNSGGTQGSTTFGIKLGADNYVTPTHNGTAVMNWAFSTIVNDGGEYIWNVETVPSGYGRYYLLNSNVAHNFNQNQLTLEYAGYNPHSIDRIKDSFKFTVDSNNIYLDYSQISPNGIATWNDASHSGKWNVADKNWSVQITGQTGLGQTFLTQDYVIFGQNSSQQVIDVTRDVIVAGMEVSGDYKFTGQGISTSNAGVGLSNITERLSIQNGAKVDFTGITGINNFANGIDLDVGTLTMSNKNQLGTDLSGIQFGAQGILNLDIADENIFDASGSLSSQQGTVNKKGAGTWQLDGINSINAFNLEVGALTLSNNTTFTATTMNIGSANQHSNLFMQSSSLLSGNTLNLNSGGAQGSTTFGIKLGADNYVTPTHNGTAVMNWAFSTIVNDGGEYIWNVETVPLGYGRYYLLNSNVAHNFNQNQLTLEYAGYNPHSIDRIKDSFKFTVDSNNIYLDYSQISPNGIATWNDASHSGKWNVADKNWSVQITGQTGLGQTFLTQDHVVFGQNSSQQTIDIANDVIVSGMEVAGDYKFTGQGISTSNTGVGLTNVTEQLSIDNGAKVDFTGITGINNFANGINISDGSLTVSNKKQLGTDLSGVKLSTQGTLNLDIAANDHFDATGSLSSQQGTVNKKGAGTWQLDGINSINAFNLEAGTLALGQNTEITTTTMTIGSANQHSKLLMQNGSKLVGDTLSLISGGANGSTTFIMALSAKNLVTGANIAAMDWDFKTIHNDGGNYTFDITKMASGVGQYLLLSNSHSHSFNQNQLKFSYAGFDPNSIERLKDVFKLTADATQVYLDYSQILPNGTATWVNTNSSSIWNVADKNWSVAIPNYSALSKTFLNKDAVVFGDQGLAEQSININAAGAEFELNGMAVNANTNYTFNGDGLKLMAGTEITKQGRGMLAFNNTITGDVDLQGGSLIIGSSSQNKSAKLVGNVLAQSGATLGGHGTIEGIATLKQGATLSPGNSIGSLTVGELNLHNGSKVVLDAAPNGDGDKIIAKKLATATGTTSGDITIGQNVTLDIMAGAGQWSSSTSYSFMTAEGTITGAFSGVTTNLAFLTPTLVTGANGAPELVMTRNKVALDDVAKTDNQHSIANAINGLKPGHVVYDAVVSMSDAEARLAYENLSGELYASTANVLFQNANRLHDGMLSRIHENNTGLWLDGWGYNGEIKGDGNAAKVENKGSGLLLGYDWAMKENILIGAALGYEESKVKIKEHNRKGENSVKSTYLMVYGNVDLDVIELKAGLNYSALRYKANRNINIPTLAGTANAKYRGHQVHAFVEASKTFNITENYDVAPYLNVAYTEITAKDFTESGSKAALHAQSQNNNRTSVTLGIKNDWYLGTDKNLAITADLGWKHTFGDQMIDQRFNFVSSDHSFNIKSASINKNSAVVGLGIKGQHKDFTIDVGYQGEFNSKVKDHALSAKLKWSF